MNKRHFIILSQLREDCTTSQQSTSPPASLQKPRGQEIELENPCLKCGESIGELGIGKGPHNASIRCKGCRRFVKWIGKKELAEIVSSANLRNEGGEA
jgi:hypothetical protein